MGTNYYLTNINKCECCGRKDIDFHLGKNSAGWDFSFHGDRDLKVVDFESWKWFIISAILDGAKIVNEYGATIPLAEMLEIAQSKSDYFNQKRRSIAVECPSDTHILDSQGYSFTFRTFS